MTILNKECYYYGFVTGKSDELQADCFFFFFYIHYKVEGIRHGLKASSAYLAHLYWISFGPGDPFGFSA